LLLAAPGPSDALRVLVFAHVSLRAQNQSACSEPVPLRSMALHPAEAARGQDD
jgi:hypothetical protein